MTAPLPPGSLIVCPLSRAPELALLHAPSHLLSLLSPNGDAAPITEFAPGRHLLLAMHDLTEPRESCVAPDENLMRTMLAFWGDWDGSAPMLVHCWAGISRSTAAAFIFACAGSIGVPEADIALALRRDAPFATPNRLMVALADDILARGGRMIDAVDRIGRGAEAFEGTPFAFPCRTSAAGQSS